MQSIEIQFNKAIIQKIKSLNFQVDQLGSILFILFALYEDKIDLLDEFDDSNKQRRALFLYKELQLRELIKESDNKTLFTLTDKGKELIQYIKENTNGTTTEQIAVLGVDQLKEEVVKENSEDVDSWIEEWLNIFPKGIRTSGKLVRSDKPGCAQKMKIFMRDYGYDKNTIIKATQAYIEAKRQEGYMYTRCAVYFIYRVEQSKEKISDLAAWCEQVKDEGITPQNTFEILV